MRCEVCLSEKKGREPVLRTFGLSLPELKERLEGIEFWCEVGPWGTDLFFYREEDRREAKKRLGDFLYSEDSSPMEEVVGKLLKERGLTLCTAESCTAGLLSARLVNVPGSSEYFVGGVVVYSNRLKRELLGVREEILSEFGAVSEETCREMLRGLKERFKTDCGVAITGIAGPGGSQSKPEGLTYVGVYVGSREVILERVWGLGRNQNRFLSTQLALDTLRKLLLRGNP